MFRPFGNPPRSRAQCPWCKSLERHRLIALYLRRERFFGGLGRVLDIGPFPALSRLAAQHASELVTLDLEAPDVDIHANIEALPLPDESFDTLVCVHVLEHVSNDRAALLEMRRILRPGGRAILQVPLLAGEGDSDEDPSVIDPAERRARFGQHDHVRSYGRADFRRRITDAGFHVAEISSSVVSTSEVRRFGLAGDLVYVATLASAV